MEFLIFLFWIASTAEKPNRLLWLILNWCQNQNKNYNRFTTSTTLLLLEISHLKVKLKTK